MITPHERPTQILVAILTGHERHGWITKELADFVILQRHNPHYAWEHTFAHCFIPAAGARNTLVKQFKDCGADWILMIDNDMSPPINLFDCIKNAPADASVVVPKFEMWNELKRQVTLCWDFVTPPQEPDAPADHIVVRDKFYELNKCGTGCIFIKPEVFHKTEPPWFYYGFDEDVKQTMTEDIAFCLKIREKGLKIYGNGAFRVGHHHTMNLSVVASMLYDKDIKEDNPCNIITSQSLQRPCEDVGHGESARPAGTSSPVEETSPVR